MIYYMAIVHFFVSFAYAWGTLKIFPNNFIWSLCSVVGIAFTVSLAYVFWPNELTKEQVWLDLLILFSAALPGMIYLNLKQWEQERFRVESFGKKIKLLSANLDEQQEITKKLDKILENQEKQSNEKLLQSVKEVLYFQNIAKEILNNRASPEYTNRN